MSANCLFVGQMSICCTKKNVTEMFQTHGTVAKIDLRKNKSEYKFEGYGFVTMSTYAEAQHAMEVLNGKAIFGRIFRMNWANTSENLKDEIHAEVAFSFFSNQVEFLVYEQTLCDLYGQFNVEVLDVKIIKYYIDEAGETHNGMGFVHFPLSYEGVLAVKKALCHLSNVSFQGIQFDCNMAVSLTNILKKSPELDAFYAPPDGQISLTHYKQKNKDPPREIIPSFQVGFVPLDWLDHLIDPATRVNKTLHGMNMHTNGVHPHQGGVPHQQPYGGHYSHGQQRMGFPQQSPRQLPYPEQYRPQQQGYPRGGHNQHNYNQHQHAYNQGDDYYQNPAGQQQHMYSPSPRSGGGMGPGLNGPFYLSELQQQKKPQLNMNGHNRPGPMPNNLGYSQQQMRVSPPNQYQQQLPQSQMYYGSDEDVEYDDMHTAGTYGMQLSQPHAQRMMRPASSVGTQLRHTTVGNGVGVVPPLAPEPIHTNLRSTYRVHNTVEDMQRYISENLHISTDQGGDYGDNNHFVKPHISPRLSSHINSVHQNGGAGSPNNSINSEKEKSPAVLRPTAAPFVPPSLQQQQQQQQQQQVGHHGQQSGVTSPTAVDSKRQLHAQQQPQLQHPHQAQQYFEGEYNAHEIENYADEYVSDNEQQQGYPLYNSSTQHSVAHPHAIANHFTAESYMDPNSPYFNTKDAAKARRQMQYESLLTVDPDKAKRFDVKSGKFKDMKYSKLSANAQHSSGVEMNGNGYLHQPPSVLQPQGGSQFIQPSQQQQSLHTQSHAMHSQQQTRGMLPTSVTSLPRRNFQSELFDSISEVHSSTTAVATTVEHITEQNRHTSNFYNMVTGVDYSFTNDYHSPRISDITQDEQLTINSLGGLIGDNNKNYQQPVLEWDTFDDNNTENDDN